MIMLIKLFLSSFPWLVLAAFSWLLMRADLFSDDIEGSLYWLVVICLVFVVLGICAQIFKPLRWLGGLLFGLGCILTPWVGRRAANYVKDKEAPKD